MTISFGQPAEGTWSELTKNEWEAATVWGIMARLGLSLLVLVIATVASLLVMMSIWPCITLFMALSVGATAVVWRRRASYKRP
jgi:hypothetical protein